MPILKPREQLAGGQRFAKGVAVALALVMPVWLLVALYFLMQP